ncbi:dihydroneopterin aldolase 1-like [Andrographis paniculata]|uniref:dihydroneopterin aldolase 1-like n=1 Tax=Andrographis paniculata TaxID=175694 RepID=UPI0021E8C82B|nr:dihydroneopterin aldolase 1-like [Andrographis paniculata]
MSARARMSLYSFANLIALCFSFNLLCMSSVCATSQPQQKEMFQGDKLVLRGLMFHGYHGVKPEERTLGQKFLVDMDAWMDLRAAGNSDSLSDSVSYTDIYDIIKGIVEGAPHNLVESVAELIATSVLSKFSQLSAV